MVFRDPDPGRETGGIDYEGLRRKQRDRRAEIGGPGSSGGSGGGVWTTPSGLASVVPTIPPLPNFGAPPPVRLSPPDFVAPASPTLAFVEAIGPRPGVPSDPAISLSIPKLGLKDATIVHVTEGDGWDEMGGAVAQYGSASPGQRGCITLSAHNDGGEPELELFRSLDRLQPGDEIQIYTEHQGFTYVVDRTLLFYDGISCHPTPAPSLCLTSCYPYQRDTHRIAVFAHLKETK